MPGDLAGLQMNTVEMTLDTTHRLAVDPQLLFAAILVVAEVLVEVVAAVVTPADIGAAANEAVLTVDAVLVFEGIGEAHIDGFLLKARFGEVSGNPR
ncbi:hypothetical protein D3C81_1527290 [compost metagenome]